MELLSDSIKPTVGIMSKIRVKARNTYINSAYAFQKLQTRKKKFLRCIYLHHVFDDQVNEFSNHIRNVLNIGEFISTESAISLIKGDVPVDGSYFHLSFDDGLDCVNRNAVPILNQLNIPAIVFVNSAVVDGKNSEALSQWEMATNYKQRLDLMDWPALKASGLEVGAHTRMHRRLSSISENKSLLRAEIAGCKHDIELQLGQPCKYFAWPYGTLNDIDEESLKMIQDSGYEGAFGVYRKKIIPQKTDLFTIPRHHFETNWKEGHVLFFANGGLEKR